MDCRWLHRHHFVFAGIVNFNICIYLLLKIQIAIVLVVTRVTWIHTAEHINKCVNFGSNMYRREDS